MSFPFFPPNFSNKIEISFVSGLLFSAHSTLFYPHIFVAPDKGRVCTILEIWNVHTIMDKKCFAKSWKKTFFKNLHKSFFLFWGFWFYFLTRKCDFRIMLTYSHSNTFNLNNLWRWGFKRLSTTLELQKVRNMHTLNQIFEKILL